MEQGKLKRTGEREDNNEEEEVTASSCRLWSERNV
jgi:hypothetical protein